MSTKQKPLIDHIEAYLGTIQRGWKRTPDGKDMDFQIVECLGGQINETRAFCTLGLSRHVLTMPKGQLRQELFILMPERFEAKNVTAVLCDLGTSALKHHSAFLRGEVIERTNPIFEGRPFYAFYAAKPILLPDKFSPYKNEQNEEVVFAWMIPISKAESNFVRTQGWGRFEELLEAKNADMIDLDRESFIRE